MLDIKNLTVVYPNGLRALSGVSASFKEGKLYGIIGPNGGGKTTLVKGILGLVPSRATVCFRNKPLKHSAQKIAYVEQKNSIDMDFPISVFQMALLGTYPSLGLVRRPRSREKAQARKAIKTLGLEGLEERQIGELSGGQFQRVLIARTLAQDADLIFLDEPFVGIDINSEAIIINLLKQMVVEGKTVFVVHHDLSKIQDYFDSLIMINRKIIVAGPVEQVFNKANLRKTFEAYNNPLFV